MSTPLAPFRPGLAAGRDAQALRRAALPELSGWLKHTAAASGCARPIRLTGTITAIDRDTGRALSEQYDGLLAGDARVEQTVQRDLNLVIQSALS